MSLNRFFLKVRCAFYLVIFLAWTPVCGISLSPTLLFRRSALWSIRVWCRFVLFLARTILGIRLEVRGQNFIPSGPAIVAAQHQSAFETYALFLLVERPVFVLKRSLLLVPIIGVYIWRVGLISIDRKSGGRAMRKILRSAERALAEGSQILIFPEGTRTPPGERQNYKPGVLALYKHFPDIPVVPMALNSGYFWGKTQFRKTPGSIVFEFLPPIPPGKDKAQFLDVLRTEIETTAARLAPPPSE